MVCEWTDRREPKDGAKCTKESWAVLKTGNLRNDLYHGDDYLDPVSATTYHNMKKRLRTHTGGAHPVDRSADDQLPRIL